ncbi:unnamed protein product [Anisakis simplex]|uniref:XK-related protein n=1 Tax=Anisakis simplex TaxID=6269 RepID=A0A0M3K6Z6_ANISI|nr:unnamed protein product [Anisakis simplex]
MLVEIPKMLEILKLETIEKVNDIITAVQDQSQIPDLLNFHVLFVCFLWIAIMMIGFITGEFVGTQLLGDILPYVCDDSSAIVLNFILIPLFLYRQLDTIPEESRQSHSLLLAFAIIQGLLSGLILRNHLVILLAPLHLANIIYIAVVSRIIGHKLNNDRQAYYGIISGIAFVIFSLSALIMGTMCTGFALNTLFAIFTSHVVIQVYMHRVSQSNLKPSYIQLAMLNSSIYAQAFVGYLCT